MEKHDHTAAELIGAVKALVARKASANGDHRWNLLKRAAGHLSAARIQIDPDGKLTTVEALGNAFATYLPRNGMALALYLVAWDLKLFPAQMKEPK